MVYYKKILGHFDQSCFSLQSQYSPLYICIGFPVTLSVFLTNHVGMYGGNSSPKKHKYEETCYNYN